MSIAVLGTHLERLLVPELLDGYAAVAARGAALAEILVDDGVRCLVADEDAGSGVQSSAWLLRQPSVMRFLRANRIEAVIPFKNSIRLERAAADADVQVLAAPAALSRRLENKLALAELAAAAEVETPLQVPVSQRSPADAFEAARAAAPGSEIWVFQRAQSHSGIDTVAVSAPADLSPLTDDAGLLPAGKLVEFAAGVPLAVTAVVLDESSIVVAPPVVQLTGVAGLTARRFASCGNDWAIDIPTPVAAAAREASRRIGRVCAAQGYRGMLGVDVVVDPEGRVRVIEINPRWTASFDVTATLCRLDGEPSLLSLHVGAVRGESSTSTARSHAATWDDASDELRHRIRDTGYTVAVVQALAPTRIAAAQVGIVDLADPGEGLQPGWRVDRLAPGTALITSRDPGDQLRAGDPALRLVARTGGEPRRFQPAVERAADPRLLTVAAQLNAASEPGAALPG